jgi:hypothetical protein
MYEFIFKPSLNISRFGMTLIMFTGYFYGMVSNSWWSIWVFIFMPFGSYALDRFLTKVLKIEIDEPTREKDL